MLSFPGQREVKYCSQSIPQPHVGRRTLGLTSWGLRGVVSGGRTRIHESGLLSRGLCGAVMLFGVSQIQASCGYSPPPLPSHGQTAETLGKNNIAITAEAGGGTVASWWDASNIADVEQTSDAVGAGRFRLGVAEDFDVSLVSAVGHRATWVVGPEFKWRFSHVAPGGASNMPGFQAAWITGVGVGSAALRYDVDRCDDPPSSPSSCMMIPEDEPWARHPYAAPYTGVLVSAGTRTTQLFTGARFAFSEVFGNRIYDFTLYPTLGFGGQLRPWKRVAFHAETDFGGAIVTNDFADTGVFFYFAGGVTVFLGNVDY